jgi:hypothetical protein
MKIDIDKLLDNNDQAALTRLARSSKFNPSDLIFSKDPIPVKETFKPELIVKNSSIHGIGVFTKNIIDNRALIEECRAIPLDFRSKYHNDATILRYCYSFHDETDNELAVHGKILYMLTGNGMLYNHSVQPNAFWKIDKKNNTFKLFSKVKIEADQEITINYEDNQYK